VADAVIVLHVVCQVWFTLLCNEADLQLADWYARVFAVQMDVLTCASSQLEYVARTASATS
jgi:hypothetical protein